MAPRSLVSAGRMALREHESEVQGERQRRQAGALRVSMVRAAQLSPLVARAVQRSQKAELLVARQLRDEPRQRVQQQSRDEGRQQA